MTAYSPVAQWKNVLYFGIRRYARYASIWNSSNNRINPNGYGSLRVTPIARVFEALKTAWYINTAFLSICIILFLPSVIINYKDLLKPRLIFTFYAQISCLNDWNNFLMLNTNDPLSNVLLWYLDKFEWYKL